MTDKGATTALPVIWPLFTHGWALVLGPGKVTRLESRRAHQHRVFCSLAG